MGGLDLCYGRWDTNQHSIADAHPGNLNAIIFPGQDFNNARIMDFENVSKWQDNKLDRKYSSRMGWSDVSISVLGPVVDDLRYHFVQRWNFIYNEKYDVRKDSRYRRLSLDEYHGSPQGQSFAGQPDPRSWSSHGQYYGGGSGAQAHSSDPTSYMHRLEREVYQEGEEFRDHLARRAHQMEDQFRGSGGPRSHRPPVGPVACQLVRSASKWSNGTSTEHSIANACKVDGIHVSLHELMLFADASLIRQASHFIYIENQFFITGGVPPVKNNLISSAIVERILRAARSGQKFKVIVVMPAIPGFAGDLKDDASLGTRAIMEYEIST